MFTQPLSALGQWLRQEPQPASLLADGKPLKVPHGGNKWRALVRSIDALGATRIEALDESGATLRACTLDESEEEPDPKFKNGVSDVQVFARLISEAYATASRNPLLDNAMQFIERQAQLITLRDREIERLRALVDKLRAELAKGLPAAEGGVLNDLVAGFLQAQAQNGTDPPPARPPRPAGGKGS